MRERVHGKPWFNLSMRAWLVIESVFIVCGSVCAYALMDFVYHCFVADTGDYRPLMAVGMIFPMSLLVGAVSYAFSKSLYQYTSEIMDAIARISDGELNVKVDEAHAGPLKDIYHKFNLMSDELASVDTMRNDFVNEFSHELKTPLASINGFSQLLLEGNCTPEQEREYLLIIEKESERLAALAGSQLLLSRLDSQQIVVKKERFSLDEQIRRCIILLSSDWTDKKLELSVDLDEISYYGSEELLQHVWINLISNAVKYTEKGGALSVFSQVDEREVRIFIRDTGSGMTGEAIAHIFGKYYRAQNSAGIKGLGLGLPIVGRVVEMSGGRIEVESEVGKGSTFVVALPR